MRVFVVTTLISFVAFFVVALTVYAVFSKSFKGTSRSTTLLGGAVIAAILGVVGLLLNDKDAYALIAVSVLWFSTVCLRGRKPS